jgi:hypothetical protein
VKYEVIVSNLGIMYQGADYSEALRIYEDYARRSSASYGRISGRQIRLIDGNRKIIKQQKRCKSTGS